jgi:hypothetical protein
VRPKTQGRAVGDTSERQTHRECSPQPIVTATTKQPPDPPQRIQFPYPVKFNSLLTDEEPLLNYLLDMKEECLMKTLPCLG